MSLTNDSHLYGQGGLELSHYVNKMYTYSGNFPPLKSPPISVSSQFISTFALDTLLTLAKAYLVVGYEELQSHDFYRTWGARKH